MSILNQAYQLADRCYYQVWDYFSPPKATYCHGTTFSALYLMSRQEGDDNLSLIPYGKLEVRRLPVFSGECFRGISDTGVNILYTSWARIDDKRTAEIYSKKFPFSYQSAQKHIEEILTWNDEYLDGRSSYPAYGFSKVAPYWNKTLLKIRQLRAWDEKFFQETYRDKIIRWLDAEEKHFYDQDQARATNEETDTFLSKLKIIRDELNAPPALKCSQQDQEMIVKTYPLIFFTTSPQSDHQSTTFFGTEYLFSRSLKVGREIRQIGVEEENMDHLKQFLEERGLAHRVHLISFEQLFHK